MAPKTRRSERQPSDRLPIARLCVDVPLAHLDRPFDYLVDAADDEAAQPGVRVKVRFAGQLVNGWVLERAESSLHDGRLAYIDKVVSGERVLDPEVARLARAVADRYAGNLSDVLRLAVPPRHARVEAQPTPIPASPVGSAVDVKPGESGPASRQLDTSEATPASTAAASAMPALAAPASTVPDGSAVPISTAPASTVPVSTVPVSTVPVSTVPVSTVPAPTAPAPTAPAPTAPAPTAAASPMPALAAPASTVSDGSAVPASDERASTDPAPTAQSKPGTTPPALAPPGLTPPGPTPRDLARSDPARSDPARSDPAPSDPAQPGPAISAEPRTATPAAGWAMYQAGTAYLRALEDGRPARAVWGANPGEDWPARIAEAAAATVRAGRGVVAVVADARDLDRLDRALTAELGPGRHVALHAAAGPAERYRRFLAASRHRVPVVVGTRAAMFAPVAKLGLVVIWDDGDDLHAEPRAPYPHAREVLLTRAQLAECAALVGGFARTGEGQLLLETGWAKEIVASRAVLRARAPQIAPTGDDPQLARDPGAATARLPSLAWQAARQALAAGAPVLVQVPRRGYLPSVACADCRTPARCPHCAGPLGLAGARDVPTCHWCGRAAAAYACPVCQGRRLRASVTGARRTAEELGRAFAGVPVRTSGREEVLDLVPAEAALVVATPGAEPVATGGYGAVLLLDAWALLSRSDLRAAEETMRRWLSAAALARPGSEGGRVVVVADGSLAPVQALLRWDPGWFAARELAERRELGFPPASRMASLTGTSEAVAEMLAVARLPDGTDVLGPVPAGEDQERMLLRVSRGRASELAHALHEAAGVRSAKRAALPVRLQVDPADLF